MRGWPLRQAVLPLERIAREAMGIHWRKSPGDPLHLGSNSVLFRLPLGYTSVTPRLHIRRFLCARDPASLRQQAAPTGGNRRASPGSSGGQLAQTVLDHRQHALDIQPLMGGRILPQVGSRQPKQRHCRPRSLLLPMDKGARKLDQPFVEGAVGALPLRQPKRFQHLVRLEESAPAEGLEKAQVARVVILVARGPIRRQWVQVSGQNGADHIAGQ